MNKAFAGFSDQTLMFLKSLSANNDRAWFEDHKDEYQTHLRQPMRALVDALAPAMVSIDSRFDLGPRGPSVSRIYRDTRFSRDKSPYRVNQWIAFRLSLQDWFNHPAFFMEIKPDGYRHGMGYYAASPATMKAVRAGILARPQAFMDALIVAQKAGYRVEGEAYKRPSLPAGIPAGAEDWFRLKSAALIRSHIIDPDFFSADLVSSLERAFLSLAPLYKFLQGIEV